MTDYLVVDYVVGSPANELTDFFNSYGADGWQIRNINLKRQNERRAVFVKGEGMAEYLVVDYDTGLPAAQLEADLDGYGIEGWELVHVDDLQQTKRRGIMMKGTATSGGGGTFPDAPADDITYGRMNNSWNAAIAKNNDVMDGGNF